MKQTYGTERTYEEVADAMAGWALEGGKSKMIVINVDGDGDR